MGETRTDVKGVKVMNLKKVDWKNLFERAAWTFAEGFLLAIPIISPANIAELVNGSWKLILAGAIGAGISAAKTIIIDFIRQYKNTEDLKNQSKEIEDDEYGDLTEYFERENDKEDDEK